MATLSTPVVLIALTFALLIITSANARLGPLRITQPFKIVPNNRPPSKALGVVYGARDCGAIGRVLQVRHEDCHNEVTLCSKRINLDFRMEIYFTANENADNLVVRVTTIPEVGQSQSFEQSVPGVHLDAGQEYVISNVGTTTSELQGKKYALRIEILGQHGMRREICAEADFSAH